MTYNANTSPPASSRFSDLSDRLKIWSALATFFMLVSSGFAQVVVGNVYSVGSGNSSGVTTANTQYSTFTALTNSTVTQAQIFSNAVLVSPTVLQVGLYAVNASGIPTGPALTTGAVTAPVSSLSAWQTVALSYTLVQGTVYALQVSTTTAGATFDWRNNSGINNTQPFGGTDTSWKRGINTGTPVNTTQNVWVLNNSDGTAIGQPYTTTPFTNLASPTAAAGERFVFNAPTTGETSLSSVNLLLDIAATPPVNPLTVNLLDQNGTVLDTGTLDLHTAASGILNYQVDFSTPFVLTNGDTYSLAAYSNGSTSGSVEWEAGATTASSGYENATYEGTSAYTETFTSQSNFTSPSAPNLQDDYFFSLNLNAVPEPATWALLGFGGVTGLLMAYRRRGRSAS